MYLTLSITILADKTESKEIGCTYMLSRCVLSDVFQHSVDFPDETMDSN